METKCVEPVWSNPTLTEYALSAVTFGMYANLKAMHFSRELGVYSQCLHDERMKDIRKVLKE